MKSYNGLLIICTLLLQVTMIRTSSLMTMMPMVMVWIMMDSSSFLAGLKLTEQFCLTHCIFKSYIICSCKNGATECHLHVNFHGCTVVS